MKNIIEIENLSCKYGNNVVILNATFDVQEADFLCIVGDNGSGKSTLIKTILGVNDNCTITGKINKPKIIGYLPQKNEIQNNFPASVFEVVLSGTIINNPKKIWYTKEDKIQTKNILNKLNIFDLKNKCFGELSGGQQQRVLIARALVSNTKVLVLDEPTNGLDPNIVTQTYELLKELNNMGLSIIVISHDVDRIKKYCKKIVRIENCNMSIEYNGGIGND